MTVASGVATSSSRAALAGARARLAVSPASPDREAWPGTAGGQDGPAMSALISFRRITCPGECSSADH